MHSYNPINMEERITVTGSAELAQLLRTIADEVDFEELSAGDAPHSIGPPIQIGHRTLSLCLVPHSRVSAARACRQLLLSLTPRQSEILALLVDGHSAKAVACSLGIHSRTVESHINHIYQKTGVRGIVPLMRLVFSQLE
jgi:DNA-binding CsgD family transcriptional regulator